MGTVASTWGGFVGSLALGPPRPSVVQPVVVEGLDAQTPSIDDELQALLQQARDGDASAVTPPCFRLGLQLAGDTARADELVQGAVMRSLMAVALVLFPSQRG